MAVFTILNHGTGFRREKENEMIADFGRALDGIEVRPESPDENGQLFGNYLITDGPGSGNNETNPLPGSYNVYTGRTKESVGMKRKVGRFLGIGKEKEFKEDFYGQTPKRNNLMGNLAGHGWSDNVTKIAYALSAMNALPDTINLAGWSRGAVTCIMAANKIYELFPEIKVNIFAIDPVAGFGNNEVSGDFNKRRTLPPSVRNFIAVLAIHEKRGFFNPVDATKIRISPRNSEGANILFLPMPGKHDSQTKQKDTDDPSSFLNLPSKVTHHLAFKFLSQFGTNFINGFDRSHGLRAVLELYSEMLLNWSGLEKSLTNKGMGQRAQGGFGKRGFAKTKELQRYTMHSNYFVNEHHRAVFRQVHPEVYDVIFSRTGHGFNVTRMRGAIAQLSTATYTSLEPYFEFTDHMTQGRLHLPIPGSGVDKDLQPLPYSQWPTLWNL